MRLTDKNNVVIGGYIAKMSSNGMESQSAVLNKLGQLEDFEEKLDIDLVTLFKASFAESLYFKSNKTNRIENKPFTAMSIKYKTIIFGFDSTIVEFKDYGKTWALTKEELEK